MVAITEHIKVPELRFPEFSGEWKRARMEQLARVNPPDMPLPNSFYYIDLDAVDKGVLKEADKIDKESAPSRAQRFLEIDDVLFQMVRPYQKNNLWFREAKGHYVASTGYAILKSKCQAFTYQLLHEPQFNRQVRVRCTGSNYPAINTSELKLIPVYHPSLPEQQKIAEFLTAVDEKIGKLKRKKVLLEAYKKGAMQKLFSQEIRFKDDQGNPYPDWVEKRLGELLEIGSGRDYKHLNLGSTPVFGSSGECIAHVNEWLHNGASVGIGRKGTIDKPIWLTDKFWTVDTLFFTKNFRGTTARFTYHVFQNINWLRHNEASGVPSLSKKTIQQIKTTIPSLPEQQKIAEFLTGIDDKIKAVASQIDKAAEFKKGLLQKMFV